MYKTVYIPDQNICVDESLCPWRGRAAFRVYMKDKPVKWGIKLYELCESESGYVWNLEVMCHQPGVSNKPHDVVHRLLDTLIHTGYRLFVDNYYCCPTWEWWALSAATASACPRTWSLSRWLVATAIFAD